MTKQVENLKKAPIDSTLESKTVAITEQKVKNQNEATNNNISSQKQLLSLAKKFSLDGSLLPEEKQAPLEDRSFRRLKLNKLRKQENIEAITVRAIQYCSNSQTGKKADQDWFSSFINLAEDISNKTMQDLWAKILAGEISHPGSFSLKTLQAFRTMSITDAKLFAKACSLAVSDARKQNIRIISGAYQVPKLLNFFNRNREQQIDFNASGLSYADILTLADNHLLFKQETESSALAKGDQIQFYYTGNSLTFSAKKSDCILTFYKFTPIGTELAQLITDKIDDTHYAALKGSLTENFSVE